MTYHDNPDWQAARQTLVDPPGDNHEVRFMSAMWAAFRMYEIEVREPAGQRGAKPLQTTTLQPKEDNPE